MALYPGSVRLRSVKLAEVEMRQIGVFGLLSLFDIALM
jgi:hypothetical protein